MDAPSVFDLWALVTEDDARELEEAGVRIVALYAVPALPAEAYERE